MSASTQVQSNASNFGDFLSGGVDPRTGHFTLNIQLPMFTANDQVGPSFPLMLSYNLLNKENQGFGKGWSLSTTRYNSQNNRVLSLQTGETFRVDERSVDGRPARIDEQKVPSFHFHAPDLNNGPYQVVHRAGQVEQLTQFRVNETAVAVPTHIIGPLGHGVTLEYFNDTTTPDLRLSKVMDDDGNVLLSVEYLPDRAVVRLAPEGSNHYLVRLDFIFTAERLARIEVADVENAIWTLTYKTVRGYDCIEEARSPQGVIERMQYADGGHAFPGQPLLPALPRVTSHQLYPGADMPPIETTWVYSISNYLGYGGTARPWQNDGSDQLYEVTDAGFRYHTEECLLAAGEGKSREVLRQTRRTYNRFHQLVEERKEQKGHVLTETVAYYTDDTKAFRDQPPYFQMPRIRQVRWEQPGGVRSEKTEHRYDTHGNLIWQRGEDGQVDEYDYYPPEGDGDHCPPEPNGFSNLIRCKRTLPSEGKPGTAPVRQTRYRYARLQPLGGADLPGLNVLKEASVELLGGDIPQTLSQEITEYYDAPGDRMLHGRVARQRSIINGYTATTTFEYSVTGQSLRDRMITTRIRNFGHDDRSGEPPQPGQETLFSERTIHCLTGTVRMTRDNEGVVQRTAYDSLNRVIEETLEGNAPATRRYRYTFAGVASTGRGNETISVDVNGVEVTAVADGLGRTVATFRSLNGGQRGDPLSRAAYNVLGQRVEQAEYDDYEGAPTELITRFTYDDWGNPSRATGPDGVVTVTQASITPLAPAATTLLRWQEHPSQPGERLGETFTQYNTFGKVDFEERRLAEGETHQAADRTEYVYDGLGRCIRQTQHLRELGPGKVGAQRSMLTTAFAYDDWDRVIKTTRPDLSEVHTEFAPFSTEAIVTGIKVARGAKAVKAGTQRYDRFGRLVERGHGTLAEQMEYSEGSLLVAARRLASGERLLYEYEPALTGTPTKVRGAGQDQTFEFDPLTGQVTSGTAAEASTEFVYNRLGEVERTILKLNNQPDHITTFSRSRQGRRLARTDSSAAASLHSYDACGRLKKTTQGLVDTLHEYNGLGLLFEVATVGPGGSSSSRREYDSLGREIKRRVNLTGMDELVVHQAWSDDDLLVRRWFESGGKRCLDETFEYDALGQLSYCQYDGEAAWLPTDRYGQRIASELVGFDELGNMQWVTTTLAGDLGEVHANHAYHPENLSQLIAINYDTKNANYPASETFAYDTQGCMTNDAQGRILTYDGRGRLASVAPSSGATTRRYHYDPHDELIATTEAGGQQTRYFHDGSSLNHSASAAATVQYLRSGDGHVVAEHNPSLPADGSLLVTDANGHVRASLQGGTVAASGYDAWGNANAPLSSTLGYNGERHDDELDGYLLGAGYRVYLPRLRRFNAPDSASPFDGGGLNPYAYAGGNPIVFHDPTGHFTSHVAGPRRLPPAQSVPEISTWQRWMPVVFGVVSTVVFTAIFPPAGAAAWALMLVPNIASIGYSVLVATQVLKENAMFYMAFVAVDVAGATLASGIGKATTAASADSRWIASPLDEISDDLFSSPMQSARSSVANSTGGGSRSAANQSDTLINDATRVETTLTSNGTTSRSGNISSSGSTSRPHTAPQQSSHGKLRAAVTNEAGVGRSSRTSRAIENTASSSSATLWAGFKSSKLGTLLRNHKYRINIPNRPVTTTSHSVNDGIPGVNPFYAPKVDRNSLSVRGTLSNAMGY